MRKTIERPDSDPMEELPNRAIILGQGVPASFELAVDGDLEVDLENPLEEGLVVSGSVVEGTLETGVFEFRFSGECANVELNEHSVESQPEQGSTPRVHLEYGHNQSC